MRKDVISGASGVAFVIGGWAVPIVFPQVDPWVAEWMLWVAAALLGLAVFLWALGLRKINEAAPPQTSAGDYSPNFGTVNGPVTITTHAPMGPSIVPAVAKQSPMSEETFSDGVDGLERAILGYKPARDLPLVGFLGRVYKCLGGVPDEENLRKDFYRQVNLTIADAIVEHKLTVWGRCGDRPIQRINLSLLRLARVDHKGKYLEVHSGAVRPVRYVDLWFNKNEIEEVWPNA